MLCNHFHWNWLMLCLHVLFNIYQIDIQLNFFSWNVFRFNWHFGVIDLCITVWLFFSFSSFRTIILLFWFQIFKLLSFSKLLFFIFRFHLILMSLHNFLVLIFISVLPILISSSFHLLNTVWFSTQVLLFLTHISFVLNILFFKNDWKKVISIKFDIRVTKHVFIKNVIFRLRRTWPQTIIHACIFWNGCDI
jgi:hypothetical protein